MLFVFTIKVSLIRDMSVLISILFFSRINWSVLSAYILAIVSSVIISSSTISESESSFGNKLKFLSPINISLFFPGSLLFFPKSSSSKSSFFSSIDSLLPDLLELDDFLTFYDVF